MRFHVIIINLGEHWIPHTRMRQNKNFKQHYEMLRVY